MASTSHVYHVVLSARHAQIKFKPIFEFNPYCTFETSIDIEVSATVRPYIGFAVSLLIYGIIGPRISPELYFELTLGYSEGNGFFWHGVLGFDLLVGIQFTPWFHWNWPDPLIDIHLLEVDSEEDPILRGHLQHIHL